MEGITLGNTSTTQAIPPATATPAAPVQAAAPKLSFWHKFLNGFEHLFGSAPKWENAALNVVNFAAPFAEAAIGLFAPDCLPVALPIINTVKSDLATLYVMTGDGTQPQTVAAVLARVQRNFGALLTAVKVKDPAKQAEFTATANLIINEFNAVAGML